jgi:uncharacterized membrane protein YkvA (DUF1232 family)
MTNEEIDEEFKNISNGEYSESDYAAVEMKEDYVNSLASKGPLSKSIDNIKTLFSMLKERNSFEMSSATKGIIAGSLLYVISPLDLVPDIIPVVGLADDAAIITATVAAIAGEIVKYKSRRDDNTEKK